MKKFLLFLTLLVSAIGLTHAKEQFYTITFNGKAEADETNELTALTDNITEGYSLISSMSGSKVFVAGNYLGFKIGASKAAGSITIKFVESAQVVPTKIVVRAAKYSSDTGAITISINNGDASKEKKPTTDLSDLTWEFTGTSALSKAMTSLTVATTSKRAYIKSITVTYDDGIPDDPTDAGLAFAKAEETTTYGASYAVQTLTNSKDLSVAYTAEPTTIANFVEGKLKIYQAGDVTIKATYNGSDESITKNTTASYTLHINKASTTLSYSKSTDNYQLTTGDYTTPTLTAPEGETITYESSNTAVATVAEDGTVSPIATGKTTITAKLVDNPRYNDATAEYTLIVTGILPGIKFDTAEYNIDINDKASFTGQTAKVNDGAVVTIKYASDNSEVATVDENTGIVTLLAAGTAKITATAEANATYDEQTASYTINVVDPSEPATYNFYNIYGSSKVNFTGGVTRSEGLTSLTISKGTSNEPYYDGSEMRFYTGATVTITVPEEYSIKSVVFTGSSLSAFDVSETYKSLGSLAEGTWTGNATTNVIAFTGSGTNKVKTITVTYETATTKSPSLSFDASVCYATVGEDFVEPTLSTATGLTGVVYSSSDSEIASVNAETGEVTPIKAGTVTITAKKEADKTFDGQEVSYKLNVLAAETYLSTDDLSNRSDLTNNTEIVEKNIAVGDAVIYFDGSSASSKTKYYLNEGIRFYANNTLTVTAPEGKYLTKITFVGVNTDYNPISNFTPTYGKIDTGNDCWLCNGEAQNSVTISTSAQVRFKGIIIEYSKYKLAHGEFTSDSQVTFLENTNSNNNLQLYGAFTPSTSLNVDSYVIRVNDIEAATIAGTADEFTLTGLPYIKDATFTIAPVVDGVELPQEVLDDVKMVNLDDFKYEFIGNDLIWLNDKATEAPYYIGTVLYFADAFGKEVTDLNYLVDVTADGYEGEFSWVDGGFTYSIANVLEVSELYNGLPKVSDIDPAPKITINVVPSYRFNYDAKYSSLLTSETPLSAPARAGESLTQIYTCASQPLQCTIDVTEEVSGVESVTVDANAPVEFFNLQGVRVDGALAPGIYIRRQGQSVSKVQIR